MYTVYPDEYLRLTKNIWRRKANEYMVQLRIATNPHLKPEDARKFADELIEIQRQNGRIKENKLDKKGLLALKERLKKESKMVKAN